MAKFTVRFYDRSPLDPQDRFTIKRETITAPDEKTARDAFEVCNCEVIDVTEVKDWQDAPEYKQALEFAASFDFAAIPEVIFVQ